MMLLAGGWLGAHAQKLMNDTGLYPVYELLDTSNNAVRILQLGDSHVQGGFLPDAVRMVLQDKFGFAGRGFVFPYNLAGTNGPEGYKWSSNASWNRERMVDRNLAEWPGPGGIMLTRGPSAATMEFTSDSAIHWLRVWYKGNDLPEVAGGNVFEGSKEAPEHEVRILADSGTTAVAMRFPAISRFYGAVDERDGKGITYSAIGINGAQFQQYNLFDGGVAGAAAMMTKPALVIFSLGTNEAFGKVTADQFRMEVEKTITAIREYAPGARFLFTTPPSGMMKMARVAYRPKGSKRTKYRNKFMAVPQAAVLRQAIIDFCREEGHAYWDLFGEMRADSRYTRAWSHDHVHFNAYGYRLQGEQLGKAILQGYRNWQQTIRKN
ncbi:GDSL-type esterase/lipase family protein [Chitinophaga sp. NPDC101104]|uniref:GDSL-type esterase/lipase family protein n=1 Tax=Chitinophaga sp. NPDC101104 TaxID=3390561 RepID=UPI003D08713A